MFSRCFTGLRTRAPTFLEVIKDDVPFLEENFKCFCLLFQGYSRSYILCNATGQYTFAFLYNVSFTVLLSLYRLESLDTSRFPASIPILLMLSKRIHSIYVLRMFNDCVAVACGYLAVLLFTKNKVYFYPLFICFIFSPIYHRLYRLG